ncbi:MAG: hypothetical protein COA43_01105 [Robiginitomaculum sp.]|nr:MAG: hypothetical protein COA43_01105 [Robiginitomaculum sp.]
MESEVRTTPIINIAHTKRALLARHARIQSGLVRIIATGRRNHELVKPSVIALTASRHRCLEIENGNLMGRAV